MDFSWSPEQRALREEMRRFAEERLNVGVLEEDRDGRFPHDKWRACAEAGVLGLNVPEALGGRGRDALTTIAALEGLGYGCRDNSLPFALNSQMWSVQPALLKFGDDAQKERFIPPLCRGEMIGAFAITEAETGSDTYAMAARAEKVDGG
ncbi:MAG: acyl-CoA dehydrogenase family protein, partial [Caulobacterales bacterium]|nr:acyl-CoA dehydrogenase family protein [Caulobacterales bacterium]